MTVTGHLQPRVGEGPLPLYYQVEQDLLGRIESEEFAAGAPLPSEDLLCGEYGVSRITVRRALEGLSSAGVIVRRRGVGSFVADRPRGMVPRLTGSLSEFLASAKLLHTRAVSLEKRRPRNEVRRLLELDHEQDAWLLTSVGALESVGPVAFLEIWFPPDIGCQLTAEMVEGRVPIVRIAEGLIGQRIVRAEQLIEADHAGLAAPYLGIDPAAPILRVRRVYFTAQNRAIEIAYVRYHPQHYRYAIEFRG
jgi:GntR family transcriptional regulator